MILLPRSNTVQDIRSTDSMALIICTVVLLAFLSTAESKCEDQLSPTHHLRVTDKDGNFLENVTSCARIVDCYPGLCETVGKSNTACCMSCRAAFPSLRCINKASKCNPVFVIPFGKPEIAIESCDVIVNDYNDFCAKDKFGGPGNACCKACKEGPTGGPTPAVTSTVMTPAETQAPTPAPSSDMTPGTTLGMTPSHSRTDALSLDNKCEDKLTETNYLNVVDSKKTFVERVTSCKRLATCHRSLCESQGQPGGSCCKSCKQLVGDLTCMNKASPCLPVFVIPGGNPKNTKSVHSCTDIVKDYDTFCKDGSFGGAGNACCRACKEAPNPKKDAACVDSDTWKLGKGKKGKTCAQLKGKKMQSCCKKNKKGFGTDMRCQAACCASCA